MGPCIVSIFQYISNKMQRYTVYFYLETALHISGGTLGAHTTVSTASGICHTVIVCALDEGWNYHPKHVEQFPDINKLCKVASCWIYIGILLGAHYVVYISRIRVTTSYSKPLSHRKWLTSTEF
jgi:hypothetical protein